MSGKGIAIYKASDTSTANPDIYLTKKLGKIFDEMYGDGKEKGQYKGKDYCNKISLR